jgi:coatomer subunit beta
MFFHLAFDKVLRPTLWIVGEYSHSSTDINAALDVIKFVNSNHLVHHSNNIHLLCCRSLLGPLPIVDSEIREAASVAEQEAAKGEQPKVVTRTRVTADGTYATESIYTASAGMWPLGLFD